MEIDEIEAILEKIYHLHDKLSEQIHSLSKSHFHSSIQNLRNVEKTKLKFSSDGADENRPSGYVFVKECFPEEDMIHDAQNLHAIRTALENLEYQLQFFHTVQSQQQVDRDAVSGHLEQSRIVLESTLAEHHGKKYKVIEEALAFVGNVGAHSIPPGYKYGRHPSSSNTEKLVSGNKERPSFLFRFPFPSFNFVKKSLKLDNVRGILGNAAMAAVSMVVFLHLQQISRNRNGRRNFQHNRSYSGGQFSILDVCSGKG